MAAFAELGLDACLIRAIEELGWLLPTPVQQEAVPLILGGGDVLAAAETGSGKTGAFALPVLQICHEALREQQMETAQPKMAAAVAARAAASAAAGAGGVGQDRDGLLQVSADGLECACSAAQAWAGGRAGRGVTGGHHYFEVTQLSDDGICRVGWSTLAAKLALGTDKLGYGFGGTGKKVHGGQYVEYGGGGYGRGDVIGCGLDRDAGTVAFYKNGAPLGDAFALPASLGRTALFPAVCLKNAAVRLHLGGGGAPFAAAPPPGATAVAQASAEHSAANAADAAANAAAGAGGAGGGGPSSQQPSSGGDGRAPTVLILEPARDLCEQVRDRDLTRATCPSHAFDALLGPAARAGARVRVRLRALLRGAAARRRAARRRRRPGPAGAISRLLLPSPSFSDLL